VFGYARPVPNPGLSQLFLLSDARKKKPDPIGPEEKRTDERATRSYSNLTRCDSGGSGAAVDGARRIGLATRGDGDDNSNASISGLEMRLGASCSRERDLVVVAAGLMTTRGGHRRATA
jgi:hypothetical protein